MVSYFLLYGKFFYILRLIDFKKEVVNRLLDYKVRNLIYQVPAFFIRISLKGKASKQDVDPRGGENFCLRQNGQTQGPGKIRPFSYCVRNSSKFPMKKSSLGDAHDP
ncbi:MAG: hypothetical protein ACFWTJ_09120 [Lachnoclostridium sp.]|jgi:hypothetical protein